MTTTSTHTAFRPAVDPRAARHQMQMSLGVVSVLAVAIGLCAAVVEPRSGWAEQPVAHGQPLQTVNAWLGDTAVHGG